jgi:hypothetical protein
LARTVEILVYRFGTASRIDPPSVHATQFPVDAELDRICLKALAHPEADRYPDAGAFAADLAAWLDGARKRDRAMELVEEAEVAMQLFGLVPLPLPLLGGVLAITAAYLGTTELAKRWFFHRAAVKVSGSLGTP